MRRYFILLFRRQRISSQAVSSAASDVYRRRAEESLKTITKVSIEEKSRGLRIKIREREAAGEDAIDLMMEVVQLQKGIND